MVISENSPIPLKLSPKFGTCPEKTNGGEKSDAPSRLGIFVARTMWAEARKTSYRTKTKLRWKTSASPRKRSSMTRDSLLHSIMDILVSMILDSEQFFLLSSPKAVDLKASED